MLQIFLTSFCPSFCLFICVSDCQLLYFTPMASLSLFVDNLPIDGVGEVPVRSNEEVSTLGYLPAGLVELDGGGRVVLLRGFILNLAYFSSF